MSRPCKIPECARIVYGHGWCSFHYQRWKRTGDPTTPPRWNPYAPRPLHERFWSYVNKDGPTPTHVPGLGPCWLWTGPQQNTYGVLTLGMSGKKGRIPAHRFSWEIHKGPIPPGRYVLHRCDRRLCVNPGHLFLGDHASNMEDMARKERTHAGLLTAEKVREIRVRAANGESSVQLAPIFGVTPRSIRSVLEGRTWRHVV